jgi:HAMP domain-containing protein
LSATILQSLAEWLLTIILAGFIIGGVIVFALTGFAWLWIKRAIGELHPAPSAVRH